MTWRNFFILLLAGVAAASTVFWTMKHSLWAATIAAFAATVAFGAFISFKIDEK